MGSIAIEDDAYPYIGMPIGAQNADRKQDIQHNQHIHHLVFTLAETWGYEIEQRNGQRYFGPPKDATYVPSKESEIFVGNIPRNVFEDTLIPTLQTAGKLYMFRLMMDFSGHNRGFGFAQYCTPEQANYAVRLLNNLEICPGRRLAVLNCQDNNALYMGGLENRSPQEIIAIIYAKTPRAINVDVTYPDKNGKRYVVISFQNHREAALARRYYLVANYELWRPINKVIVDWRYRHYLTQPLCDIVAIRYLNRISCFKCVTENIITYGAIMGALFAAAIDRLRSLFGVYAILNIIAAYIFYRKIKCNCSKNFNPHLMLSLICAATGTCMAADVASVNFNFKNE